MTTHGSLTQARRQRMRTALQTAPFDAFIALSAANVQYATGYRSQAATVFGGTRVAAVVTGERTLVAAHVAEAAEATSTVVHSDDFIPFGRFYFESATTLPPAFSPDARADLEEALHAAIAGVSASSAVIGYDEAADPALIARLSRLVPSARFVPASHWAWAVRARKLPEEVELIGVATRLAEDGIMAAMGTARIGIREQELADVIVSVIAAGGGEPRFCVVSSGPRSAHADVFATGRRLEKGDLLRFDVGCRVDGYWSDIGRTAVVGSPTAEVQRLYAAILAGQDAELAHVRPGVRSGEIFDLAVGAVIRNGITDYRRQHCGHGIGLDVYEPPIIEEGLDMPIEEGMTLNFETPYYLLGWGGMMVEDTVVVTPDGHRRISTLDRELQVIPA